MRRNIFYLFVSIIAVFGIELLFEGGKVSKENLAIALCSTLFIWVAIVTIANRTNRQSKG